MTLPGMTPILLTLAGVSVARMASATGTRWLLGTGLVMAAAVGLAVLDPAQRAPLAIGVAVAASWPLVVRDRGGSSWRVWRPLLGLLALGTAMAAQAWLLELTWAEVPSESLHLALALLLLEPATRAVRFVLGLAGSSVTGASLGAGEMIGVLERLVILLLILEGAYAAIGFVIAAKGLARYEKMKDERQAEYVLLGTLASVLLVLLAGLAAHPRPA